MTLPRNLLRRALRRPVDSAEDLMAGPIRGELLGAEHLAERARDVARAQVHGRPNLLQPRARLLVRLDGTRKILEQAYHRISTDKTTAGEADPSGEWLLDNYHVVQDHMQEVRDALPRGYYRELPELTQGPLTGYPRVYDLAIALISHSEGRIDLENVDLFVEAFQEVSPLSIGELWAIPAMLRLGLIENVRRMTLRTLQRLDELHAADVWARRIHESSEKGGTALGNTLRNTVGHRVRLTPIFVARLLSQLRLTAGASPALLWLERWLSEEGLRPDDAAGRATQRVAHTQIMMANSITSLRTIGRRDWRRFVEGQSGIEALLRTDPARFYSRMNFATRDRYRHVVERIARRSGRTETVVAASAIGLATAAFNSDDEGPAAERRKHVGYYLIDDGLRELERLTGSKPQPAERLVRSIREHPDLILVGGLGLLTALALIAVGLLAGPGVAMEAWPLVLLFTFLPAWDIGISTVNQLVTAILPPRVLPSLDLQGTGVPQEYHTAVVVPTLFGSEEDVRSALENIEVLYLANRDGAVNFAILSDFTDADAAVTDGDDALIALALEGVASLNKRYSKGPHCDFYLLHRPRRWNEQQGTWMGWERKRGKLTEFNRLLRGESPDAFSVISSDPEPLRSVRYVITLDADTVLPQGAATTLVGTMAHPLNRPVHDTDRGRVVAGYGILQPRVGVSLTSAYRSRFASIHAGQPGVDPYTTAVSDVYQDLYGEGSFTGKGIYDVDAFEVATHGRFPENTLLSHDLIEGNFARAGLATGIIVYDDYPASYLAHARRKHRWIRGDWQLLPWLRATVPGPDGVEPNRLSLVGRWKILDNLRRSTVELAQLALIIAAWTVLDGSPIRWTLLGIGAIAAPWIVSLLLAAVRPPSDKSLRAYYGAIARDAVGSVRQVTLAIVFLPHQAWLSADAIVRTLWRLFFSRKQLLEWQSAAQVQQKVRGSLAEQWSAMWPALLTILVLAITVSALVLRASDPRSAWPLLVSVWPLTLLWLTSPLMATRLGRPIAPVAQLSNEEREQAARYAALHWTFFDKYANESTNWLAPDNVQFDPEEVVAMRTSPTNIGLQLLSNVSAHDLGLIELPHLVERLERIMNTVDRMPRFRGHLFNWYGIDDLRVLSPAYVSTVDSGNLAGHLIALRQACIDVAGRETSPRELGDRLVEIGERAYRMLLAMDFTFLFDAPTRLFAIGYHTDSHTLDASFYDLLASEARLAVFVAIAKDDVPMEAWFRLGRSLVRRDGVPMMVSWSGSMFEYLMPDLVMETFPGTLLDQSDRGAVRGQINYGRERGVPWGVSESAYNVRDQQQTYQYRAFGVPALALKRGLGQDLVIAPYASALAAQLMPTRALANLKLLEEMEALGPHGFWDAIDYSRPGPGDQPALVKTVMAHHVGMTMVALTNVLQRNIWPTRFHREAMVRAAELLLQERVPRRLVVQNAPGKEAEYIDREMSHEAPVVRHISSAETAQPRVALLGDLPYTVMVSHAGGGFSRYDDLAVTRWRGDGTTDDTGQFCYVHDLTTGRYWSTGHQPTGVEPDHYNAMMAPDRVTLNRTDGVIETRTEIVVVQGDAAEVRRVTLTNHGEVDRELELTSYAELVMSPHDTDAAHPAFSNLFVETEWHDWCTAILARRRPRREGEPAPWCVHVVDGSDEQIGPVTCETDRARFVGRGRTVRRPLAMEATGPLSGTVGAVLDPIISLRTRVRLAPGESTTVSFTTLVATTRELAFELADRYRSQHAAQRALDLAWMATQLDMREIGVSSAQNAIFQEIAGHLIYGREALLTPEDEQRRNRGGQPRLWNQGISGDLPILLAFIDESKGLSTLRELFTAHRFLRRRGLAIDLVVILTQPHDYLQELKQEVTDAMFSASDSTVVDQPGGVFIRRRDAFEPADYLMLSATARVHIHCDGRPLNRIVPPAVTRARPSPDDRLLPMPLDRRAPYVPPVSPDPSAATDVAELANGYGELDADGNYRIRIAGDRLPPAPWSNVIANEAGGFLVTERGSGCTWSANSYFFRLTPWRNDPVSDQASDVIYIRDSLTGESWCPTPAPMSDGLPYDVVHAPGSTTFAHRRGDIETLLTLGLPNDSAVKLSLLRITNHGEQSRTLTFTAYAEWTLGVRREVTGPHIRTNYVAEQGALMARNSFDPAFEGQVAFMAVTEQVTSYTADRREFLGRHGSIDDPAAMRRERLAAQAGVGLDPCAALRFEITLAPGETREVAVLLGAAEGEDAARQLIASLRDTAAVRSAIDANLAAWQERLGVIQVSTPEPLFDAMLNRWSLYQALSSRMWARMALYQSSGAYGFRDQLQDVMAFVYAEPAVAREHLVRAASRQFVEGDVQHWWHPHTGRGVRTRFSDDLAWLPFVVDHYVRTTADSGVLDEVTPYITMRALEPHEHEIYDLPQVSQQEATVYQHCVDALRKASTRGRHGLPLIGSGDWNDGFSRVGIGGEGESVWLAWFLITTCRSFADHADARGDAAVAAELRGIADHYTAAADEHAWDGEWYRRAWYDDGAVMGSKESDDCQIDSIAQSWSVISGAGSAERQQRAMQSLEEHLVRRDLGLIRLLTPAFDSGSHDPGYIKGYLPGVRENGGQYTHAALWAVQAVAMQGDGNKAMELFQMLNPFNHSRTREEVERYRVEPYVIAADIYTATGHEGRGGWTWYTGSASWTYRVALESLLGFELRGNKLTITPRVPDDWPELTISYRFGRSTWRFVIANPAALGRRGGHAVELVDDGEEHVVRLQGDVRPEI